MFLSCSIIISMVLSKWKKKRLNFGRVALTLPWRYKKKHQAVQARTWEQHGSVLLLYTSSGTRVMRLRAKTRRRLNTVTHHMDALLTKGLCLFWGLFFLQSLSHVCQKEMKQADLIQSNPGTIAHVTNLCVHWDEVRFSDALISEIKRGWRDCDGLMSWKSKAKTSSSNLMYHIWFFSVVRI